MSVDAVSADNYRRLNAEEMILANKQSIDIAKQFDAYFLQSVFKSENLEQHFTDAVSAPIGTNRTGFHGVSASYHPELLSSLLSPESSPERTVSQADNVITDAVENKRVGINPSVDEFIKTVWPYAVQAANLIGLDPGVLVAQAALETGWGHHIAKDPNGNSSNNLFNIKASANHSGQSVAVKTTEFIADKSVKLVASFKKYPTVGQSFEDYVSLIKKNPRYQAALSSVDDPRSYAEALQNAGYATDPEYANKIVSIYQGNELRGALERCGIQPGVSLGL